MKEFLAIVGGAIGVAAFLLVLPLLGPLIGAFTGFVIGFVFDDTSRTFLDAIGMRDLHMWQFGAMLGFVGGFFKATLTAKK